MTRVQILVLAIALIGAFIAGRLYFEQIVEVKYSVVDCALAFWYKRILPLWETKGRVIPRLAGAGRSFNPFPLVKRIVRAIAAARKGRRQVFVRRKRTPILSERRIIKRAAHRYVEKHVGHPVSWKHARQLMNQWGREGRAIKRAKAVAHGER